MCSGTNVPKKIDSFWKGEKALNENQRYKNDKTQQIKSSEAIKTHLRCVQCYVLDLMLLKIKK